MVGFCDIDGKGQEGIEAAQDADLVGVPGSRRVILRDRAGHVVEDAADYKEAQPGQDVSLSLDLRLQYLAYRELKSAVEQDRARGGLIVVADARDGDVLALASQPGYNPNRDDDHDSAGLRDRAVTDRFEPGSTIKPLLISQALETHAIKADIRVDTGPGFFKVSDRLTVHDVHPNGVVDLAELLAKSSNVGAAKIGLEMGAQSIWTGYQRFGVGEPVGSGLPGEASGVLHHYTEWGEVGTATAAYGYGLTVNALQLVRAYCAIANDGLMPQLSILRRAHLIPAQRVISEATSARSVRSLLEGVVAPGGTSGARAAVAGYRIAGKTGTVRKNANNGSYLEGHHQAVFIGMLKARRAPAAGDPGDDRRPRPATTTTAAPCRARCFLRVMAGAARLLQVPPTWHLPRRCCAPPMRSRARLSHAASGMARRGRGAGPGAGRSAPVNAAPRPAAAGGPAAGPGRPAGPAVTGVELDRPRGAAGQPVPGAGRPGPARPGLRRSGTGARRRGGGLGAGAGDRRAKAGGAGHRGAGPVSTGRSHRSTLLAPSQPRVVHGRRHRHRRQDLDRPPDRPGPGRAGHALRLLRHARLWSFGQPGAGFPHHAGRGAPAAPAGRAAPGRRPRLLPWKGLRTPSTRAASPAWTSTRRCSPTSAATTSTTTVTWSATPRPSAACSPGRASRPPSSTATTWHGADWARGLHGDAELVLYGIGGEVPGRGRYLLAEDLRLHHGGLRFELRSSWGEARIDSRLLGRFNVYNLLAALAALLRAGSPLPVAAAALAAAGTVPGRIEAFHGPLAAPLVVVDYAHTPQALTQVLQALRAHTAGRLVCVFGCGGDRDRGKRPLMGAATAALADAVIITDDNPRGEDPAAIVAEILAGIPAEARGAVRVQHDRPQAIRGAVQAAGPDDVVLIAGKGHEDYQIYGSERRDFSDRAYVAALTGEAPRP